MRLSGIVMKLLLPLLLLTILLFGLNLWWIDQQQNQIARPSRHQSQNKALPPAVLPQQPLQSQLIPSQQFAIQWGANPEAPFHISQGPDKGRGFCDVLLERLKVYLPDVRHQYIHESHNQIRRRMDAKEHVCFPCTLFQPALAEKNGRIFSKPTHYYAPHGVIATPAMASQIRQRFGNPVDLSALLASELRFGYPPARRYGELQEQLDQYSKSSRAPGRVDSGTDVSMLHFQMLNSGQLDATLDYRASLNYYQQHAREPLEFLSIAGHQHWLPGAISCPDSNWGQLAVLRINAVVDKIRQDKQFQQNLQFWFNQELPLYPVTEPYAKAQVP